jgi:hypothetical protein
MDRTDQVPSPQRVPPFTGADALRALVRLLAKQAAREVVVAEGREHTPSHGCEDEH